MHPFVAYVRHCLAHLSLSFHISMFQSGILALRKQKYTYIAVIYFAALGDAIISWLLELLNGIVLSFWCEIT